MTDKTEPATGWQKAAIDATIDYTRFALNGAEQLLKLNIENARSVLEQNGHIARELLSAKDAGELAGLRVKLAQECMLRNASYIQTLVEVVSQTQAHLAGVAENQLSRINRDLFDEAGAATHGIPGSQLGLDAAKSSIMATSAVLDNLSQAARQFQELSEASIKAATADMVRGAAAG